MKSGFGSPITLLKFEPLGCPDPSLSGTGFPFASKDPFSLCGRPLGVKSKLPSGFLA